MSNDIIHVYAESRRDETSYYIRIESILMTWHGMALMDRLHSSLYGIIAIAWYAMVGMVWYGWLLMLKLKLLYEKRRNEWWRTFLYSFYQIDDHPSIKWGIARIALHHVESTCIRVSRAWDMAWHGMSVMDIIHCMALHCVLCVLCIWILTWHGMAWHFMALDGGKILMKMLCFRLLSFLVNVNSMSTPSSDRIWYEPNDIDIDVWVWHRHRLDMMYVLAWWPGMDMIMKMNTKIDVWDDCTIWSKLLVG